MFLVVRTFLFLNSFLSICLSFYVYIILPKFIFVNTILKYFYNFQFFISRMKIGSPFEASHTFYFSVFELLSVPDSESVLVSDLVFSVSSVLD